MEEKKDYKLYLDTATLAGKLMLQNGAEIYRVEDTIQRMLAVSGLKTAEAYVTATGIMVTLDDPKEDSMTVIKRIPSRGTDLNTVSIVNDISRKFCSGRELFEALKIKKIFVRYFNKPRIDNYLRITIGTDEEMDQLLAFLKKYIQEN